MVLSTEGNVCCYDGIYACIGNSDMIVYYYIVYVGGGRTDGVTLLILRSFDELR